MTGVVYHKPGTSIEEDVLAGCAALHVACLPRSLLSRVGKGFTRHFYRSVANSASDALFYIRDAEGGIAASLVMSEDPDALTERLPKLRLLAAALLRPRSWLPLLRAVFDRTDTGASAGPTIVVLFTDARLRRRGLSRHLVEAAETLAAAWGRDSITVVTENRKDNSAISFYLAIGYRQLGRVQRQGQDLLRLGRDLRAGDTSASPHAG